MVILPPSGKLVRIMLVTSKSETSSATPKIFPVEISTHWTQNSRSIRDKVWISLKSKRSKRTICLWEIWIWILHLILSSALESEKMIIPENNSSASIRPIEFQYSKDLTIIVSIPYSECRFIRWEYILELSKVNGKIIAYAFETTVKLTNFGKRKIY